MSTNNNQFDARTTINKVRDGIIKLIPKYSTFVSAVDTTLDTEARIYHFYIRHHSTVIARVELWDNWKSRPTVKVHVDNGGFFSSTTKSRLDSILLIAVECRLYQRNYRWYIYDTRHAETYHYYNGMIITRDWVLTD